MKDWESIRGALAVLKSQFTRQPGETYAEYILRRLEWEDRREPEIERDRR